MDERVFPNLMWLQEKFSFTAEWEPPSVTVGIFPPILIVNIPLFWKAAVQFDPNQAPVKPVLHMRIGWRRDMVEGKYLPTAAIKIEERTKLW